MKFRPICRSLEHRNPRLEQRWHRVVAGALRTLGYKRGDDSGDDPARTKREPKTITEAYKETYTTLPRYCNVGTVAGKRSPPVGAVCQLSQVGAACGLDAGVPQGVHGAGILNRNLCPHRHYIPEADDNGLSVRRAWCRRSHFRLPAVHGGVRGQHTPLPGHGGR